MPGDDAPPSARDDAWRMALATPDLDPLDDSHAMISARLRASVPGARVVAVQRVQQRALWRRYAHFCDEELKPFNSGDANETYLWHGTGATPPSDVLAHGLDPRFGSGGGFYGQGTYLAERAAYSIGGRYAHRVRGSGGARMSLLLVRVACGAPQDLGARVDAATKAMRMPDARPEGGRRYDCVRAGPHRPFVSGAGGGGGGDGDDASVIHVLYESRQM